MKCQKIERFFENKKRKIIIEIGSGIGENLFYLANKYPKRKIIGIDPFKNGLANIANSCLINKIKNIYLFPYVFQKFVNKFENYFLTNAIFFSLIHGQKKTYKKRDY